jgi:hypothetical protein
MKYTLYKPNSKNTGSAFSFEIGTSKNGETALYVSMIQQHSWNDVTKNGSFKENSKNPEKSASIKISVTEAGEFLSSFKTRIPYTAFHKTKEDSTIIKLNPWDKVRKIKEMDGEKSYNSPAFGFSVSRNSNQNFKLPLEAGEVEVLAQLLIEYIKTSFTFSRKQENNNQNTYQQNKQYPSKPKSEQVELEDDAPF